MRSGNQDSQHVGVLKQFSQPGAAEIPIPDRDVLLDHYLPLLSDDKGRLTGHLLENGNLGRIARERAASSGVRGVRSAELSLPTPGA